MLSANQTSTDPRPTGRFTAAIAISAAEACERAAAVSQPGTPYARDMVEAALAYRRIAYRAGKGL